MGNKRRQAKRGQPVTRRVEKARVVGLGGRGDAVIELASGERAFAVGGAPDDHVVVEILGRRAGVLRAEITELIAPGGARVEPFCEVAGRCGGCAWQHVTAAQQRLEKRQQAVRAIGPVAAQAPWVGPVPDRHWRRRVRAHFRRLKGRLEVGFLGARSHELVAKSNCPVLVEPLQFVLPAVRDWLGDCAARAELAAVAGAEGVVAAVHVRPRASVPAPPVSDEVLASLGLIGLTLAFGHERRSYGSQTVTLSETAGALPIRCSAEGFCQAGAAANVAIRLAVTELLDRCPVIERAQEFFSGSGNLTALLCGRVAQVDCIERDAHAVARARETFGTAASSSLAGTTITVQRGDAAACARPPSANELWLLDPGRPGAADLMALAARRQPAHVLYVSCAFDTLGRDVRTLIKAGYQVVDARLVDTFVHTPHFEIAALLSRP